MIIIITERFDARNIHTNEVKKTICYRAVGHNTRSHPYDVMYNIIQSVFVIVSPPVKGTRNNGINRMPGSGYPQ